MPEFIDNVMLRVLDYRFPYRYWDGKKIALVGEKNGQQRKGSLAWKMANELFTMERKNITVFTKRREFTIEEGEHFDMLISVRSCEAEELVLQSATKYNKAFALLPCECKRSQVKIVRYIRDYHIIEGIETYPGIFYDGNYDSRAWMVLYAIKKEV